MTSFDEWWKAYQGPDAGPGIDALIKRAAREAWDASRKVAYSEGYDDGKKDAQYRHELEN